MTYNCKETHEFCMNCVGIYIVTFKRDTKNNWSRRENSQFISGKINATGISIGGKFLKKWFIKSYKYKFIFPFKPVIDNKVKVKVSHDRPRWPKGFRVD